MARQHSDNPLSRPSSGNRQIKKLIVLATEGHTEPDYFTMRAFRKSKEYSVCSLRRANDNRSDPKHVLNMAKKGVGRLRKQGDQIWVVIDRDTWDEDDILDIVEWAEEDSSRHVILSNPKFELFVLLHFEDGRGCTTAHIVDDRLDRKWPNYHKGIPVDKFNETAIDTAIQRSSERWNKKEIPLHRPGSTNAHVLAKLLRS